ncbi:unnamed protein product [Dibothriocephalus latus]|uniref:Uncharacterized protein n=1 Tax=Dibothriocephalus latus TaxID=60516 RepID=A0A3P7LWB5_DIBLA|nr:unnamed protein product [Dibothriocephalus latus]
MTPAKSIKLQYPEMNSNGTMTQPHQFSCGDQLFVQKPELTEFMAAPSQPPQNTVEGHFQSQPPSYCHMFSHPATATTTSNCSDENSRSCYTPPSSIAPSFCSAPGPSSPNSVFSFNPPRSLIDISQQFSWPEQNRDVVANSCISSEPEYVNRRKRFKVPGSLFVIMLVTSFISSRVYSYCGLGVEITGYLPAEYPPPSAQSTGGDPIL